LIIAQAGKNLEASRKEIRIWGWGTSLILCILAGVFYWRGLSTPIPWLLATASALALSSLIKPLWLRPLYRGWITGTRGIGKFNTYLLLGLMFYLIFAPIGLAMRLLKIDLLNRNIERKASSYWIPREQKPFCPEDYERQF
jgi:hypothetical protein